MNEHDWGTLDVPLEWLGRRKIGCALKKEFKPGWNRVHKLEVSRLSSQRFRDKKAGRKKTEKARNLLQSRHHPA